ncbi:uncharacterized protein BDR25DRAFT_357697 [Lindgomyces ingoldianus]|uniref:Uncharacterized protein n=1 Tax=Lindgomyces ingoldianus TaxID=673940 RepID=A0ACB6QQK2_9PLEO|nr:uncharacterized protein BDR25DRAFT_357697 [Lindgomyces ingoldianus]KAF2468380.1 hypothetical protein BDR25DRAFT_357697 [Lindgomyces ingoldianus]
MPVADEIDTSEYTAAGLAVEATDNAGPFDTAVAFDTAVEREVEERDVDEHDIGMLLEVEGLGIAGPTAVDFDPVHIAGLCLAVDSCYIRAAVFHAARILDTQSIEDLTEAASGHSDPLPPVLKKLSPEVQARLVDGDTEEPLASCSVVALLQHAGEHAGANIAVMNLHLAIFEAREPRVFLNGSEIGLPYSQLSPLRGQAFRGRTSNTKADEKALACARSRVPSNFKGEFWRGSAESKLQALIGLLAPGGWPANKCKQDLTVSPNTSANILNQCLNSNVKSQLYCSPNG